MQLIGLQDLDNAIAEFEGQRSSRPGELASSKRNLADHEARAAEASDICTQTQKRIDEQTLISDSLTADAQKLEGQLYSLKSNDDFNLMKQQIKTKRDHDSNVQDKILELMMALDDLKDSSAARQAELGKAKAKHAEVESDVVQQLSELEDTITAKKAERVDAAGKFEPQLLEAYERICARREGIGIAALNVEGETCTGCFTQVMMQVLNAVMSGKFTQCPHCDRILYLRRHASE